MALTLSLLQRGHVITKSAIIFPHSQFTSRGWVRRECSFLSDDSFSFLTTAPSAPTFVVRAIAGRFHFRGAGIGCRNCIPVHWQNLIIRTSDEYSSNDRHFVVGDVLNIVVAVRSMIGVCRKVIVLFQRFSSNLRSSLKLSSGVQQES